MKNYNGNNSRNSYEKMNYDARMEAIGKKVKAYLILIATVGLILLMIRFVKYAIDFCS